MENVCVGLSLDTMGVNKINCSKRDSYFLYVNRLTSHIAGPGDKGQMEDPPWHARLSDSLPVSGLYCEIRAWDGHLGSQSQVC